MKYRTLFISDIHLGSPYCESEKLLLFLKNNSFDKIYLIGDIIDMINMRERFFWKSGHNDIIKYILKLSKKVDIIYIVGNHDYFMESFVGESFGNIKIKENDIHVTSCGLKYYIQHGHQYDGVIMKMTWLYVLGDKAYGLALWLNKKLNKLRKLLGYSDWSLSMFLKYKVKNVIKFVNDYEKMVVNDVIKHNVDGVVLGHIHMPANKMIDGFQYLNCGCWTESPQSYIVENENGNLILKNI